MVGRAWFENVASLGLLSGAALLAAASVLADQFGFGSQPGIGPSQIVGLGISVAAALAGLALRGGRLGAGARALLARKPMLAAIGLLFGVVIAELSYRGYEWVLVAIDSPGSGHPSSRHVERVPDSRLETRMPANIHQHDDWGYRNRRRPKRVEVVALGDSQTWGHNVGPTGSWPERLAHHRGLTVYNMGIPGWGPVQYYAELDRALSLSPRYLIVALYLGNDLWDAARLVYLSDSLESLRASGFDPASCAAIGERGRAELAADALALRRHDAPASLAFPLWLREHSAIANRLSRTGYWPGPSPQFEQARLLTELRPGTGLAWSQSGIDTVIKTTYRELLDLEDSCIAEGLRITVGLLDEMGHRAHAAGATPVLLLIPTKASVFSVATGGLDDAGVAAQVEAESLVARAIAERARAWTVVSAETALARALARGTRIYPDSSDDHFLAAGYDVIAAEVATVLASR